MPDTGAPWNIPYVASTDLVSDWPADSLALANAIDAGLDVAGNLVDVKSALFTGTQTNSTAAGANFSITDLSITHTLADSSNKLIISAYIGAAGSSAQTGIVGIAVADDGTLVGIGDASGTKTRVAAGGRISVSTGNQIVAMPSITFVYAPGDTASHTYTVEAINISSSTRTVYINRNETDTNINDSRASSALVIQEVKV